jgi:predicted ATPase
MFKQANVRNGRNALTWLRRLTEKEFDASFFEKSANNEISLRSERVWIDYREANKAIRSYMEAPSEREARSRFPALVSATLMMSESLLARCPKLRTLRFVWQPSRDIDGLLCEAWRTPTAEECAACSNLEEVFKCLAIVDKVWKRQKRTIPDHLQKIGETLGLCVSFAGPHKALSLLEAFECELSSDRRLLKVRSGWISQEKKKLLETLRIANVTAAEASRAILDEAAIVGRSEATSKICDLLLAGQKPVVTIVGEGGIGKTTLALTVSKRIGPSFGGRVSFVKLALLRTEERLARHIVASMELQLVADHEESAEAALVSHFANSSTPRRLSLLVLDNCEHLNDAPAKLIARLIKKCPTLRVLATSRRALELRYFEQRFPLLPLAYELEGISQQQDVLKLPAVRLFLQSAEISEEDVRLSDDIFVSSLAKLSKSLQGIPLCIVLAGARYGLTRDIASILSDADILNLSSDNPEADEKDRAVRASIEWSEKLLSPTACTLFHRVSVFYGGWDNVAMLDVCFEGRYRRELFEAQSDLERLYLISVSGARHKMMNPVLRSYAFERLQEAGEAEPILQKHALHYAKIASEEGPKVLKEEMTSPLQRISLDSENFARAFEWSRQHDRSVGLKMAIDLCPYWIVRGLFSFGRTTLREFLDANPKATAQTKGAIRSGLASLSYFQSHYGMALDYAEQSLKDLSGTEDTFSQVAALTVAGIVGFFQPLPDLERAQQRAEAKLDKSVELADGPNGSDWLSALAHSNRAFLLSQVKKHVGRGGRQKLVREAELAVAAAKRSGNEWIINVALTNQAFTISKMDPNLKPGLIVGLLEEALKSRRETGDRYGVLQLLGLLAFAICTSTESSREDFRRAAILLGAQDGMQDQKELPIPALNLERINHARELVDKLLPGEGSRLMSYARQKFSEVEAVRIALKEQQVDWRQVETEIQSTKN